MGLKRFLILLTVLITACTQRQDRQILARVGDRVITPDDLIQRAEFSPEWFLVDAELSREEILEALIDEKRLAMQAEERGRHRRPQLEQLIDFIEDLAVMRELFRRKVAAKVSLDEAETAQAIDWSRQERKISYLTLPTAAEAEQCRAFWQQNSLAETLRKLGRMEPDTLAFQRIVRWGEREGPLEETIFTLGKGEISPVVKDDGRYYVLRLDEVFFEGGATQLAEARRRSSVERTLRSRKESRLSRIYVAEFMSRQEVRFNEPVVRRIVDILAETWLQEPIGAVTLKEIPLSESAWQRAQNDMLALQAEELVSFRGGRLIVHEFLQKWRVYRFPVDRSSRSAAAHSLNDQFSLVIRDHLLTREGRRLGLHKSPAVKDDVARWRDHYLAEQLAAELGQKDLSALLQLLRRKQPAWVDSSLLAGVELTSIPVLALRPGQYASRVTPPWPSFFKRNPE